MASTLGNMGYEAAAKALNHLVSGADSYLGYSQPSQPPQTAQPDQSVQASRESATHDQQDQQQQPPSLHVHAGSNQPVSHSWLSYFYPSQATIEALENRFHMGNYVIDRATGAKSWEEMSLYVRVGMHLLYYGRAQEYVLSSKRVEDLLESASKRMGVQYDDPASKAHIEPFIASFGLADSMKDMVQPDPSKYANFNEFFGRAIKPEARPAAEPHDDNVTSCPADCRLTVFPSVDAATKFWIKGQGFTLASLLGSDELAAYFNGGALAIARLAPQDYHRWHSPVSGIVENVKEIKGTYYTVNPQAVNEAGIVDVFCQNRRSVLVIRRPSGSKVALVAVGAMLVGSLQYQNGANLPGTQLQRGQVVGAFYYGGSTTIVVYPAGEVDFDADLLHNSTEQNCETLMRVGGRIGTRPST